MKRLISTIFCVAIFGVCHELHAMKNVAYIYGDVAPNGTIPSGGAAPYHQMLLTDTGNLGCSQFRTMVEAEGYTISQHYDQTTTLDTTFLSSFDVVVFGLHQKIWSIAEQTALDTWIQAGGGIMMYSDSAAGGQFDLVGIGNPVGQTAVNSILSNYGMQVAVDQGGGVRAYTSSSNSPNPIIWDQPVFEGEGVSPIAVDPTSNVESLIPLASANQVSGGGLSINTSGITISNPNWAVIARSTVGQGNIIVIFDRQPMWNNGPGSDINARDNREILRRIIRYLARDYGNSSEWLNLSIASNLELSYRQWSGGIGLVGYNYIARNNLFGIQHKTNLLAGAWTLNSNWVEQVSIVPEAGGETEIATIRLLTSSEVTSHFARISIFPATNAVPLSVEAGMDHYIGETGNAWLEGSVSGATTSYWSKITGPGAVTFANASSAQTTASFDMPGTYDLQLTSDNGFTQTNDSVSVTVVANTNVVRAINCGGSAYVGSNGFSYEADTLFSGGHVDAFPGNAVENTGDDLLYNYARSSHSAYNIPVANGNYTVYLQFAETWFTQTNGRVFDTFIEGSLVIDNLDIYADSPGKWVAYDRAFSVTVSDGTLNITFAASINNSLLNSIIVIKE